MKNKILSLALALVMLVSTFAAASVSTAAETRFDDVKNDWSYEAIMYVAENGIMVGVAEGQFAPDKTMTRAEVVMALYNLAGKPAAEYVGKFSDVDEGQWFTSAVMWAVENEITAGVGDGRSFAPNENLTRDQLAMFVYKYAEQIDGCDVSAGADLSGYSDYYSVQPWAKAAMSWMNYMKIMVGVDGNRLAPKMEASRAQFAKIIHGYDSMAKYNEPKYGQNYAEPEYEFVEDADIYVSTTGDNSATGTKDDPIRTFSEAKERVRALKGTKEGEIKVAFFAGNYGYLDTLLFEEADGGDAEQPITYCAYGDGDVVFSNGVDISNSDFEPITADEAEMFPEEARANIYKVDLNGKIDEFPYDTVVFGVNGICEEARFPNADADMPHYQNATTRGEIPEGGSEKDIDSLIITTPWIATRYVNKFSTYEGLKITGHLRTGWFIDTFPVKSYDASTKTMTIDFANWNLDGSVSYPLSNQYPLAYEGRMPDTIYFHNLAEFLDNDGEYWIDKDTKTMYVYNPVGDYAIPTGDSFFIVGYGVGYLNFVGLDFSGSKYNSVATWGANSHITFDMCSIGNVSGKNVIDANGIRNFTVKNCEFYNFVCGGVVIQSDVNRHSLEKGNNSVTNNYFHDFGRIKEFDESVAIQLYTDVGAYIANNEFVDGAHGAIRFDRCIETIIEYNVFDNMMATTSDFGAVYTYILEMTHRGNVIRYNMFMNMRSDGAQHGVYLDGACGQEVYGNLFYNCGSFAITMNGARDNVVYDNIVINLNDTKLFMYGRDLQNIMDSNNPYGNAIRYLSDKPEEGEAGYAEWLDRWPILYQYTFDTEDLGDYYCVYTCVNHLKRNKIIGGDLDIGEPYELYADKEDIEAFEITENPYFADPTHGDYTIVNTDAFEEVFPFDMVGRK